MRNFTWPSIGDPGNFNETILRFIITVFEDLVMQLSQWLGIFWSSYDGGMRDTRRHDDMRRGQEVPPVC